jgi:DNA topoisomerase-1
MNNITARAYIKANPKRQLEATALGSELIWLLRGSFEFLDCEYTKNMEEKLDQIAQGKADYLTLVRSVNAGLERELSSFKAANTAKCPDCGTALRHLVKSGSDGYNFWACTDRENCGAKFQDDDGKPGQKQKSPQLSEHKCQVCGQPLRHIVREGSGGYDFWGCSGRECRASYKDDGGKPGRLNVPKDKQPTSEFKCKSCKSPLCRRQGHSRKTGKDYDFFACSSKKCGKTYQSKDGNPKF